MVTGGVANFHHYKEFRKQICAPKKIISLWKAHAMAKLPVDRQLDRNGIRQNRVLQG